jgi:putative ABC transport system permease protein
MGSNMLTIFNGGGTSNTRMGPLALGSVAVLQEVDADLIGRDLKDSSVVAATPQVRTSRAVVYQNNNYFTSIQGSGVQFPQIRGWEVAQGRFFTEQETRGLAKVCVLGTTVRDNLFPDGEDPIGKIIRISSLPFEVVGVLESKGAGMMGDQDDVVVAPYTTVMRKIQGADHIQNILVSAQDGKSDLAELEITALLRQRLRLGPKDDNSFTIRKQDDWVKMQDQQASVLTTFLAMAASISLLVGGIGISNIMLVSVTERTREIGVRRALGATRANILWQFLTEAVVLSCLGGIIGVGFAMLTIWVLKTFTTLPAITDLWAVALGLGFSGVVGVAAGFLPALKAAKLNVIDALRYE